MYVSSAKCTFNLVAWTKNALYYNIFSPPHHFTIFALSNKMRWRRSRGRCIFVTTFSCCSTSFKASPFSLDEGMQSWAQFQKPVKNKILNKLTYHTYATIWQILDMKIHQMETKLKLAWRKFVKSHQVDLFLAGYSHLESLWGRP